MEVLEVSDYQQQSDAGTESGNGLFKSAYAELGLRWRTSWRGKPVDLEIDGFEQQIESM